MDTCRQSKASLRKASIKQSFEGTLIMAALVTLCAVSALAQNPVPFVNAPLVPGEKAPGSAAFTLTVNGAGFVSGATVNWNGNARATTFVSNKQLTTSINAADVLTASTASVTVVNPAPGGGTSNVADFQVLKTLVTPGFGRLDYVTDLSPQDVAAADFNHDGRLDLALPTGDNTVSVLLGNGDGTFQSRVEY
ncbi:MAG: FG-GAP repeat domain-containing protein, partial [Candidatus Sulfotelmatobacter sp.]